MNDQKGQKWKKAKYKTPNCFFKLNEGTTSVTLSKQKKKLSVFLVQKLSVRLYIHTFVKVIYYKITYENIIFVNLIKKFFFSKLIYLNKIFFKTKKISL
jgi:hypothetical protein